MFTLKTKLFATCLVALVATSTASALVPCDKHAHPKTDKIVAQVVAKQKTGCGTPIAVNAQNVKLVNLVKAKDGCGTTAQIESVEKAARDYLAQINKISAAGDKEFCAGGASVKALMTVLKENDEYRPMVEKFEQFMAQQMNEGKAVAQINAKGSDCATKCATAKAKNVAQINAKPSDCATSKAKNAAQINATPKDGKGCSSKKPVAQINNVKKSGCGTKGAASKNVAQINAKDIDCATKCATAKAKNVAQINATPKDGKGCSSKKPVAQISNTKKSGCGTKGAASKNVAQINAKDSDCAKKCATAKAKNVAQINAKDSDCAKKCATAKNVAQINAASNGQYVAFECSASDKIARVAARSYLDLLFEIKNVTGNKGCPLEAANKTLATVIADLQNNTVQAQATDAKKSATVVSLGALKDRKTGSCTAKPAKQLVD